MAYGNNMATAIRSQGPIYGRIHSVNGEQSALDVGELVRLRTAKGWSKKKLATTAGVDYSSYWRIETGRAKNPRYETVQRLADALEVNTADLFTPVERAVPPPVVLRPSRPPVVPPAPAAPYDLEAIIDRAADRIAERTAQRTVEAFAQMDRRRPHVDPMANPVHRRMIEDINAQLATMTMPGIEVALECVVEASRRFLRTEAPGPPATK
jgi:transcriptional regulator with XRE-family HTH domain